MTCNITSTLDYKDLVPVRSNGVGGSLTTLRLAEVLDPVLSCRPLFMPSTDKNLKSKIKRLEKNNKQFFTCFGIVDSLREEDV